MKKKRIPAAVLEQARLVAKVQPADKRPRAGRDVREKVITALKRLHPMD